MSIEIIEQGLHTTIQDQGRFGFQSYGIPVSGAMDDFAAKMANLLLNNEANLAVLEMGYVGPTLTFHQNAIIAVTGADMSANINDQSLPMCQPVSIQAGDTLQFRTVKTGGFAYLAVKEGFDIPAILGSRSTVVRANIDGILGRKLAVGDVLPLCQAHQLPSPLHWGLSSALFDYIKQPNKVIRYLEGAQSDWFESDQLETRDWALSTQSNRMGYRLEGTPLEQIHEKQLLTEATAYGSIQVPPNGLPIILMADGQPTGGYPKIGQVVKVDLGKVSQIRPGQPFTFQKITLDDAISLLAKREVDLKRIQTFTMEKWGEIYR
ncbi:biotin-dependent carboxyltransferase family protein [Gracilibacillus caseinilyticus]|uniref:Biotin-dependent carboxyltransferase family protein n=1 Tax=Gracilibacillus caseinilyticus TaxID=2932256 RepID=A0ABY4EVP2_9BACI|nr:biotin-dependent carboxyltransferase family protein [Gracilibacillus caseinilyticus]UOQ48330.1 biotin-dependent carboxyltransferase family protein [Gracilibacillus caseinilyticus]